MAGHAVIVGLVLMVLAVLALDVSGCEGQPHTTAMEIETGIRNQLRPGAPRSRVVEFLRAHNVAFEHARDTRAARGSSTIHAVLSAPIPGPPPRILEMQVRFEFDGNDRLASYSSHWQTTPH